ncbi:hypothetical protein C3R44_24070, partial [Mycobacterium tuberculosis]
RAGQDERGTSGDGGPTRGSAERGRPDGTDDERGRRRTGRRAGAAGPGEGRRKGSARRQRPGGASGEGRTETAPGATQT